MLSQARSRHGKRLEELAARTGRTKSYYAREALLEHLDEMEDRNLAIERLENPAKRWSLEDLERDAVRSLNGTTSFR